MSVTNNQATVFSSKNAGFMIATGIRWLSYRDVPQLIKKYVDGKTTLDYGCGKGTSTLFLKSCRLNAEGVDISEEMIDCAKLADPSGQYTVISSGKIPRNDNYYDLIFSNVVLPYISTKVELVKVLKELRRCLKVGGTIIASVTNEHSHKYNWRLAYADFPENKNLQSGGLAKFEFAESNLIVYAYFWSDEDYREAISDANLKIVDVVRPLGKESDGYDWVIEKEKPPFTIYIAKKEG